MEKKSNNLGIGILIGVCASVALFCVIFIVMLSNGTLLLGAQKSNLMDEQVAKKISTVDSVLHNYYYKTDIDDEAVTEGIYRGMVAALKDPYSEYYSKEELDAVMNQTQGIYYGIGAYVGLDEEMQIAKIVGVFEGSPAEAAGLMEGDLIIEVAGESTVGMSTTEVVTLIKGEEGTSVHVKFSRDGESFERDIVRKKIESPTVSHEMMEDEIGYLRISEFDEITVTQFEDAMADLRAQGMKGLILDLRDNPGGSVSAVLEIARQILPEGLIVYTEDREGNREEQHCDGKRAIKEPLVVLINGNSASASEILSGAIKDHGTGTLVGTKTFGKGVIQRIIDLKDGTAVKITISSYFSPKGNEIHEVGISPDVECELDVEQYLEDGSDNQLERAKEILKQEF
ncbi:MAG: S41 family peptidase [Lachnospiraceae bacterium]|nr:S41 family peptidase [Lachnospiraceae bacterium]